MNCDGVMKLCRDAAKARFPGCDAEGDIVRMSDDAGQPRAAWLSGCNRSGWVAAINVHAMRNVVARYEAHGATKGWASGALARSMGVEIPDGP